MAKKKKGKEKQSESPVEEELFSVEVILSARVAVTEQWEYLVKWANYDESHNSWEPAGNVKDCDRLLSSFWKSVEMEERPYEVGETLAASQEWIDKEVQFFNDQLAEEDERKENLQKKRKEKQKMRAEKAQAQKNFKSLFEPVSQASGSSGPLKVTLKVKPPRASSLDSTIEISSSSDGQPPISQHPKTRKRRLPSSDDEEIALTKNEPPRKVPKTKTLVSSVDKTEDASTSKRKGKEKTTTSRRSPSPLFSEIEDTTRTAKGKPAADSPAPPRPQPTPKASNKPVGRPNQAPSSHLPSVESIPGTSQSKPALANAIPTKQRLAQKSLELTMPKAVSTQPKISKPKAPVQVIPLAMLSFKKIIPPVDARTDEPKPSPATETVSDVPIEPSASLHDDNVLAHMYEQQFLDFDQYSPKNAPEAPLPVDPTMQAAEEFLSSIMPAGLAAPLESVPETTDLGPVPPKPLTKSLSAKRIPKRWQWNGELFVNIAKDNAERICDAVLIDPTIAVEGGLRLSVIFDNMNSLRLKRLLPLAQLDIVLRACTPVQQLARLGPQEQQDGEWLENLAKLMVQRQQVAVADMVLDLKIVGLLVVFSPGLETVLSRFQVPSDMQHGSPLLAALFGWALPSSVIRNYEWRPPLQDVAQITGLPILDAGRRDRTLRHKVMYHHALRILKFPDWLHDTMSTPNRPYCVWYEGGDDPSHAAGLETVLLNNILKHCGAKNVGYKTDVRAVFVHVGALRTLCKLPAFPERRSRRVELRFFTYGTHAAVAPERWGIREIYPLGGGIVTFTPGALLEDPIGTHNLIMQIAKHPLWCSYLLPSVVGMLAKLTCPQQDPLTLFDQGEFFDDYLLSLIEDGQVSLLRAPPPITNGDTAQDWMSWQFQLLPLQTRGILEFCMQEFTKLYTSVKESDWRSTVEVEISEDMSQMQLQPAIMDAYRRCVVIKGVSDHHLPWDKDGLEWCTVSTFSFKDNFYVEQQTKDEIKPIEETKLMEGVQSMTLVGVA